MDDHPRDVPNFDFTDKLILRMVIVAFIIVVVLCLGFACIGAPAPVPKPPAKAVPVRHLKPSQMARCWDLVYGGGKWTVSLTEDGGYATFCEAGAPWIGRWHNDAQGDAIVDEHLTDENGNPTSRLLWRIVWNRDAKGLIDPTCPTGNVFSVGGLHVGTFSSKAKAKR